MTDLTDQITTLKAVIAKGEAFAKALDYGAPTAIDGVLARLRRQLKRLLLLETLNIESQADLDFIQSRGLSAGGDKVVVMFPDGRMVRFESK